MKQQCKELRLDSNGKREAVKRRLKEHLKEQKLVEAGLVEPSANRNVDFFVVIDFEATCEARNPPDYKHEIIEFPAVLVSSADPPRVVDIFHAYCRPVINPTLSDFCRELTGIEQSTVDVAATFPEVHERFLRWMEVEHRLGVEHTFCIITDGPFDMGRFLYLQSQHLGMTFPTYAKTWVNLRKAFANFYKGELDLSTVIVVGGS
jgi:3'-5' exoribonuclease 1